MERAHVNSNTRDNEAWLKHIIQSTTKIESKKMSIMKASISLKVASVSSDLQLQHQFSAELLPSA